MGGFLSWDATAIIDTGRNGVADMRMDCKNWCNPRDVGVGVASTSKTEHDGIDAFFWLKTPGESDGCTQELPDGKACPRYDSMCGSADSIGSKAGEPKYPEAGAWFDYAVKQLAANAHMSLVPAPSPPSPPAPPSPNPPTPPAGRCCFGTPGGSCASMSSCQGGWCGISQSNCEGNCNGQWCPQKI